MAFIKVFIGIMGFLFSIVPLNYAAESNAGLQVEWEKTVAAAKKEGQVNVYITGWGAVLSAGEFQKRYPANKGRGSSWAKKSNHTACHVRKESWEIPC